MNFKTIASIQSSGEKSRRDNTLLTVDFSLRSGDMACLTKSRRDNTLLTVDFSLRTEDMMYLAKSRRDDTLLTVDFSLRSNATHTTKVPQGRHLALNA
jgi:hypothetical protein